MNACFEASTLGTVPSLNMYGHISTRTQESEFRAQQVQMQNMQMQMQKMSVAENQGSLEQYDASITSKLVIQVNSKNVTFLIILYM